MSFPMMATALMLLALCGCNVSSNMAGVEAEKGKAVTRADHFQAVAVGKGELLAVGSDGIVARSKDEGKSWSRQMVGGQTGPSGLISISVCPDGAYVALDFYRKIWLGTTDGKWSEKEIKSKVNPLAMTCDSENKIWVVGSRSTILSSADKGATWQEKTMGVDAMLVTVQFVDAKHGFITGEFGIVYSTADGGANWTVEPKIAPDFFSYGALFTDANTGWVSGLAGTVMHTKDGGKTWSKQANKLGAPMYQIVAHGGDMIALGISGLMFKLQGEQWELMGPPKSTPYLRAAASLDAKRLLIAGGAGALEVITTGGAAVPAPATKTE
ncbi:MAG: YCF48-related protein [Proteobacteria bacterium]|nr:YCF48-related protein [Pseudomonadota bacterium]